MLLAISTSSKAADTGMCALPDSADVAVDHPECLFYTGTAAYRNKDYAAAQTQWLKLVQRKDLPVDQEYFRTDALNNLGYLAYMGLGRPADKMEGLRYWHLAFAAGHEEAAYHLCHALGDVRRPEFDPTLGLGYCREAQRRYAKLDPDQVDAQVESHLLKLLSRLKAPSIRPAVDGQNPQDQ